MLDDYEVIDDDGDLIDEDDDDNVLDEDIQLVRMLVADAVDAKPIGKAVESLPSSSPVARELITSIQEMHQLLGDADAYLADKLRDIESSIRLLFMEFYNQPGVTLLGVLSTMDTETQLTQISKISDLLIARVHRIAPGMLKEVPAGD